jgi:hypothetical protein
MSPNFALIGHISFCDSGYVKKCKTVADSHNARRVSLTPCFSKVEHSLTPYLQLFQQFAERLRRIRCHVVLMVLPRAGSTVKSQIFPMILSRHDSVSKILNVRQTRNTRHAILNSKRSNSN